MQTSGTLYGLLGVPRGASQDDIRKAHRNAARKHHPDANPGDRSAEERFKEIQRAYDILSNPAKKREYDDKLRASARRGSGKARAAAGTNTGEQGATTVDISDLLGKPPSRSGKQGGGGSQPRGEEIARLAKLLGLNISSLSKLLGKNIRMNVETSVGEARWSVSPATDEAEPGGKRTRASADPGGRTRKPKKASGEEKKVKGPKARRRKGD